MTDITVSIPDTDDLIDLARQKAIAEIKKIDAERSRLERENEAQDAIIRQLKAEADSAEIRLAELRTFRSVETARDFHNRVYRFADVVDYKSVDRAIDILSGWDRRFPGQPIDFIINSPGGSVDAGMELFDYIQDLRKHGHFITTIGRGMAASMGGILLQAGDKRVVKPECMVLLHEPSSWAMGKASAIEDEAAFLRQISRRVLAIFARRSAEAFANGTSEVALTVDQLENGDPELGIPGWKRREWWLDSDDCLRFGIVDEIG